KTTPEIMHVLLLTYGVVGGKQQHGQLGQLGWLKIQWPQGDPAICAIDLVTDVRNQHQHQHEKRHEKKRKGKLLPYMHGQGNRDRKPYQADCNENGMANEKVI